MTTKHENYFRNFIKNFTAYEISFITENIFILVSLTLMKKYIPTETPVMVLKLFLIFFTVMLIVLTVLNNFMKFNKKSYIEMSYRIQKTFIMKGNLYKTIYLIILNTVFFLEQIYPLRFAVIFLIIIILLQISNTKYYKSLTNIKKEVLDNYDN